MAAKKMKTLDIGKPIQILRGAAPPMVAGHHMTIGDLLMQVIPMLPDRGDYMRIWRLGMDIDRAIGAGEKSFELSELDHMMLKKNVIRPDDGRETWAKANLEIAFED